MNKRYEADAATRLPFLQTKILFISLGCDKNLVDSEVMLGLLDGKGFQIVDEEEAADVIVVNTCCFIHDAKEESIQTILEMAEYKKEGSLKALIVTGCLAQRYRKSTRSSGLRLTTRSWRLWRRRLKGQGMCAWKM